MNIILIGFKKVGKTSIAKALSKKMNRIFIDTDDLIEKKNKMTCYEIYKKLGTDAFRKIESKIIKSITYIDNAIISVGGGAIINENNLIFLRKNNFIIYLKAALDTLKNRILKDDNNLHTDNNDPIKSIESTYFERLDIYEEIADMEIDVEKINIEDIVKRLKKL